MGVRHEELLQYVDNGENCSQLVFPPQPGSFLGSGGCGRSLLVLVGFGTGPPGLRVNAGGAGLKVCGGEGQHHLEKIWEAPEEPPGPVGVAEERAGGQHGVGEHAWKRRRSMG